MGTSGHGHLDLFSIGWIALVGILVVSRLLVGVMAARKRRAAISAYAANNKLDLLGSWVPKSFKVTSLPGWGLADEAENVVSGSLRGNRILIFDQYHKAGRRSSRRTIVAVQFCEAAKITQSGLANSAQGADLVGDWLVLQPSDKLLDVAEFEEELLKIISEKKTLLENRTVG